ncbi:HU family DNA-binding protein [Streptomyces sp. NPDC044948]|uniref:HU family DNA-binding protein n=1 Tax=Streptomyces sp. NPDC044948 TaxID=3157092 RepID=UPI00340D4AA1
MKKKPTRITRPLTTTTLIETVASDLGVQPADVHDTVMATFDVIARAAASGHKVAITNFGTFRPYRVGARTVRDPRTGDTWQDGAHQKVGFRVSPSLADAVRRRLAASATIRKLPKGSGPR